MVTTQVQMVYFGELLRLRTKYAWATEKIYGRKEEIATSAARYSAFSPKNISQASLILRWAEASRPDTHELWGIQEYTYASSSIQREE